MSTARRLFDALTAVYAANERLHDALAGDPSDPAQYADFVAAQSAESEAQKAAAALLREVGPEFAA